MPPKGVKSRKRSRQYEKVLKSIKSEGRYKGRQKEVAARIVNKTRRKKGETKSRRGRKRPPAGAGCARPPESPSHGATEARARPCGVCSRTVSGFAPARTARW